jgi:56kDa selenium binding protein (SBP56)
MTAGCMCPAGGAGELKQYDVSDIFHPREIGSLKFGGIVRRQPHPAAPDQPQSGGPQMVELSRDGQRVYVTNSLYGAWDPVFYPDGVGAWMAKLGVNTDGGGITPNPRFFPHGDDFRGLRVYQTRLAGGDASATRTASPGNGRGWYRASRLSVMKGHAVFQAIEPGASAHAPAMLSGLTLAGTGLIAAAIVAGAWLAFRRPEHREIWFVAAAGALLIIAGPHLLPDAWAYASTRRDESGRRNGHLAGVTGMAGSSSDCPRSSRACSAWVAGQGETPSSSRSNWRSWS